MDTEDIESMGFDVLSQDQPINVFQKNEHHAVFEAIADLRRLGLHYEEVLHQSGCDETFLKGMYSHLGLPLTSKRTTESITQPYIKGPFYDRNWLKNLTIIISDSDLSDEEESNAERQGYELTHKRKFDETTKNETVDKKLRTNNTHAEVQKKEANLKENDLKQKEADIRRMRIYIEQLERSKANSDKSLSKNVHQQQKYKLKSKLDKESAALKIAHDECITIGKNIEELSVLLLQEQQKLADKKQKIEGLETSIRKSTNELELLERKEQLETTEATENLKSNTTQQSTQLDSNDIKISNIETTVPEPEDSNIEANLLLKKIEKEDINAADSSSDVRTSLTDRAYLEDFENLETSPQSNPAIFERNRVTVTEPKKFEEYRTCLSGLRSYTFHPYFDPSKLKSITFTSHLDPERCLCNFELTKGKCVAVDCKDQHFRDLPFSENQLVLEWMKDIPADSREIYKQRLSECYNVLLQAEDTNLVELYSIIKEFRKQYLNPGEFLSFTCCGNPSSKSESDEPTLRDP
ncbi:hypothetical protein CANARDRAFT_26354 [[Candida] arabinofermentans NRRL YB-2248]|uniref:Putative zinc-finger domain-containing protein n=1 Tax=[Candida] arabinofermentans NRRL YB-2248 TaxID=983967 RepID=A0A1E4T8Y5_9ASCO|nr:hypothetical protein CANARDRAFT_26354 [[Candida] arabinofermentans NRRL YB-2248]